MDANRPDNNPRQRIEITEADLVAAPSAARSPAVPPPAFAPSLAPTADASTAENDWTESTRLMCAAAYLDGTFAQDVVDEALREEHRAVQIPAGVDIVPVARHCLAALRQKTTRDALLCLDAVFAVVALFGLRSVALLLLSFLIAWAVVFWDMWMSTYYEVVKRLNARAFSPQDAPVPLDSRMSRRIEELAASQKGNTTVYSGFLPFVGAGFEVGGWSLVVDLRKGKPGLGSPSAVDPGEVYTAVRKGIEALGIPNLSVEDRLYVQGTDIRYDPDLLPHPTGRPASTIETTVMQSMIGNSTQRIRHYQGVRVVDWRGELVVSLYLRFPIRSGRMFCEYNNFLLPPLKEELHRADALGTSLELRQVLSIFRRSGLATLGLWPRSPRVILKPLTRSREVSRKLKEVERNPLFDYGARHTALDRVRSTNYRRFFQRVDKEMYVKLLERLVLDKIIEVLSKHDIDTSSIDETRATIINNGVMTGGGSVTAQNLAVGSSAGIVNRVRGAMSAARGSGAPSASGGGEPSSGGTA
jgi:hypothetical protein